MLLTTLTQTLRRNHLQHFLIQSVVTQRELLQLFTTIRNKMKNKLMSMKEKILLRKRVLVETVNDQLKNISQLEHTRHRSVANFFINALAAIAAYIRQPKKPRINLGDQETGLAVHF